MGHKTQPVSRARGRRTFVPSDEAAALLGVRRRTLYTYASRGLLRRGEDGYLAEDVRRLAARADAHRGHTAVAAAALRWGAPVLDTAIADVSGGRLSYRGHDAIELARSSSFEAVVDLLLADGTGRWPAPTRLRATGDAPFDRLLSLLPQLVAIAGPHDGASARALLLALASAAFGSGRGSIASRVARALALPPSASRAIDTVLVLCADHELNVSTFVARIAASAGASLGGSVAAALATFTGRRHGAACTRVETFLRETPRKHAKRSVTQRLARGESIPGFGHPLYPDGDPRAAAMWEAARAHVRDRAALDHALGVAAAVEDVSGVRASVDFALVGLTRSLGLADGTAITLFALGRSAGWLAHALEQRGQGELLRPRARYVGR